MEIISFHPESAARRRRLSGFCLYSEKGMQ